MAFTVLKTEEELAKAGGYTVIEPETPEAPEEEEKEGFFKGAKEFVKGAFTEPVATAGGLITGGFKAIGETGATLTKGLKPDPAEFTGKPTPAPKFQGGADVMDIRGGTYRPPKPEAAKPAPMTPEAEKVFERAEPVGKFTGKMAAGIGLAGLTGGTGVPGILASGAAANLPFVPQAFEEGGVGGAMKDMALNTAIDLGTLGASKAIPGIKQAILKKFGKEVTEEAAEKLAKEAFKKAKQTPKQVKADVEKGFIGDAGEEILPSAAPKKGVMERTFGRMEEVERSALTEPLKPKETPFTEHAKVALASMQRKGNPSALDVASRKATTAVKEMSDLKNKFGQKKGNIIKKYATKPVEMKSVREAFLNDAEKFLRGTVDEKGVFSGGIDDAQNDIITLALKEIDKLGQVTTVNQADILKSRLTNIIKNETKNQVKPNVTQADAIIKAARRNVDKKLKKVLPASFGKSNKRYSELTELINNFQKRLGEVVDPKTGQTRMAAGFLKSALMSNSDRGSKAMFEQIRKETGINLIKEAHYAQMAMEAVNDPRITDLLKEVGGIGKTAAAVGIAGKVVKKARQITGKEGKTKLDEMIEFYNKQQGKQFKGGKGGKPFFLNEKGSVRLSGAKAQTKTDNFKKWFGDWEGGKGKASKVVDESGEPLVVQHVTNEKFTQFDPDKAAMGGTFWFTADPSSIKEGLTGAGLRPGKKQHIIDAYLSIKKMAGWPEYEKWGLGELKDRGFDGVKLDNDYIVFNSNQIKSATGNTGAFSPDNPSILGKAKLDSTLPLTAATAGAGLTGAGVFGALKKKKEEEEETKPKFTGRGSL